MGFHKGSTRQNATLVKQVKLARVHPPLPTTLVPLKSGMYHASNLLRHDIVVGHAPPLCDPIKRVASAVGEGSVAISKVWDYVRDRSSPSGAAPGTVKKTTTPAIAASTAPTNVAA